MKGEKLEARSEPNTAGSKEDILEWLVSIWYLLGNPIKYISYGQDAVNAEDDRENDGDDDGSGDGSKDGSEDNSEENNDDDSDENVLMRARMMSYPVTGIRLMVMRTMTYPVMRMIFSMRLISMKIGGYQATSVMRNGPRWRWPFPVFYLV